MVNGIRELVVQFSLMSWCEDVRQELAEYNLSDPRRLSKSVVLPGAWAWQ